MKLTATELSWGGPKDNWWWINWWNPIRIRKLRYFGYDQDWYDGPISSFGWWYGNVSWRLPWTSHNGGMELDEPRITSREMAIITLRHDPEVGLKGRHYFNVYVDTRTGEHRTLFGRGTALVAAWERQAVRDGWWGEKHLRPAYVVRVRDKAVARAGTAETPPP